MSEVHAPLWEILDPPLIKYVSLGGHVTPQMLVCSLSCMHSVLLHLMVNIFPQTYQIFQAITAADPGFPVGGAPPHGGECQPPMRVLLGGNVCENERIGFRWGKCNCPI